MITRLKFAVDKLVNEVNKDKINPDTCKILIALIKKYINFIEPFASDLQFETLELVFKIEQMEIEKKKLLKWLILNRTSEILLNIIDESTLDFALENYELVKNYDFKDIVHRLQIELWNEKLEDGIKRPDTWET